MSKKLLMNNYSENGLMPIVDGLICWLDGRDGSGTNTIWEDRSNNENNVILKSFRFDGNSGWMGTGLRLNAKTSSYCDFEKPIVPDICTLEIYTLPDKGHSDSSFISQSVRGNYYSNKRMNLGLENTKKVAWYKVNGNASKLCYSNQEYDSDLYEKIHLIYTCDTNGNAKSYFDGIYATECKDFNITGFAKDVDTFLGRHGDKYFDGVIYSVRIYNRALTEEEIQHNYLYEQSIERGE